MIGAGLLGLLSACGGEKKQSEPSVLKMEMNDSLSVVQDSVAVNEVIAEDEMLPPTADESFADFVYNFAVDEKLQRSRIQFPLPYYTSDHTERIAKEQWEYDPLFSRQDTYTVLFDRAADMDLEKDTTMTSVKVEWIFLQSGKTKRYYFERLEGQWKLEAIDFADRPKEESGREDFFDFYARFANDSVFQLSRLHHPLKFVTADPEDEFQILETILEPGQWLAFQPELPREFLTNVNYGQHKTQHSRTKVIEIKGFGNGFNNTLYFECRHGEWKLVQFEDLSD